jgi:hypothetical protein
VTHLRKLMLEEPQRRNYATQNSCSTQHSTVKCSNALRSRDKRGRRFTRPLYAIADPAALLTRQAAYSKRTPTCQRLACLSRLIENPAASTNC